MANQLPSINHIVVLMLENRSFDHMLGLLYSASGNVSPRGQPFEGLTGKESTPAPAGRRSRCSRSRDRSQRLLHARR